MSCPINTRFHYQLNLTIFGALLIVVLGAIGLWQLSGRKHDAQIVLESVDSLEARRLLSPDSDPVARRRFLTDLSNLVGVDFALFSADNRLIDAVGVGGGENVYESIRPAIGILLSNGSWIEVRGFSPAQELYGKVKLFVPLCVLIAVLCYPVVRRLTRRLERLQSSVEALGSGDLTARVRVEGCDEVARLAQSFNSAAEQIEQLVEAHKLLLANVSHELRTPLSRLRLTAELLKEIADPKRKADLEKDVTEIDALIDQILLSSRLNAVKELDVCEDVDLLALAAEESARCAEGDVTGEPVIVRGDPTLLRRMVRNLIENAQQHGSPPVEVRVLQVRDRAVLTVSDGGEGIPAAERERVFAPFYRPHGTHSRGSGLGLALVRQIARQHGGEASAAPTLPSTIEVRLPTAT
ncbi:ATP-binding protein [Hyphomicrobium sp. 2TAF46]|uniref:sensor histidine kinase n=1 Tax=Hyphomicrobium sp. 2TAF46 TaxID=3233019 RepID=UPI003F933C09